MAMNHQISSKSYDRYHGSVKAKELRSQKQPEHGGMRTGLGEEGRKPGLQAYGGFDRDVAPAGRNGEAYQPRGKTGDGGHRHGEIDRQGHSRNYDNYDFAGYDSRHDAGRFPNGKPAYGLTGVHFMSPGTTHVYQVTQITVYHSDVFSGVHLGNTEKGNEARQNFLDAVRNFVQKPSEKAYKSLNDAMVKLMDPKFAPAKTGGAAQVNIRNVNGSTMAKITMEVTPAPTKTLEEARDDLHSAYSSKRNGEKDIASIRAEAYTNYIRALSEKFKKEGVISHTNNTPTTPVYKSSVIYVVKVTQLQTSSFHELKKPDFRHNFHGRLTFKNHRGSWNDYHNRSYVDMLRHGSGKPHVDKDYKKGKSVEANHSHRHSGGEKTVKTDNKRHHHSRADKAS